MKKSNKFIFVIFFLSVASSSAFSQAIPFKKTHCLYQLQNTVNEWKSYNIWASLPSTDPDEPLFQSATNQIGVWVQIQRVKDAVLALRITAHTQIRVSFSPPSCHASLTTQQKSVFSSEAEKSSDFTDKKFSDLVNSKKSGIIFLWSPQMPYSMKAVKNIREATHKSGIELTIVLDSKADYKNAQKIAGEIGLAKKDLHQNRSVDLMFREGENHFPTVLGYTKGMVSSVVLPGFALTSLYDKYIADLLK